MNLAVSSGKRLPTPFFAGLLAGLLLAPVAGAQDSPPNPAPPPAVVELAIPTAPVEIDGTVLFRVRGASALPAGKREDNIAGRIVALARGRDFLDRRRTR